MIAHRRAFLCLPVLLLPALSRTTWAQSKPSETDPLPSCLDQSITDELGEKIRPRGVQKRVFLKKGRFEVLARGGIYAADLMSSSYDVGGAVAYFPAEDLGVEIGLDVTRVELDLDEPLAEFFGDRPIEEGYGMLALASLLWSPIHFKVKTGGGDILHGDGMFALGAGRLFHHTTQGIGVSAGILLEMYATRWLSIRFDVRDVVLIQEVVGETRLTNNVVALLGIGLWVPFGF